MSALGFLTFSLATASNLSITVVTTSALGELTSSKRCLPLPAWWIAAPQLLKVLRSWSSRSMRSFTKMIFGFGMVFESASALPSMTMVMLLPEPVVCQMTPPSRVPSLQT